MILENDGVNKFIKKLGTSLEKEEFRKELIHLEKSDLTKTLNELEESKKITRKENLKVIEDNIEKVKELLANL